MIFLTLRKLRKFDAHLQDGCILLSWFKSTYGAIITISAICQRLQNPEWNDWNKKEFPDFLVWLLTQRVRLTKACINRGVDVNMVDKFGHTALYYAIFYKRIRLVKYLLKREADVNVVDKNGKTPLSLAKAFNRTKAINLLKEKEAEAQGAKK